MRPLGTLSNSGSPQTNPFSLRAPNVAPTDVGVSVKGSHAPAKARDTRAESATRERNLDTGVTPKCVFKPYDARLRLAVLTRDGRHLVNAKVIPGLLRKYFADPALASLTEALNGAMANQVETGVRDVSGGAKSVEILDLQIDGDTARADARALIWLRTEPVDPGADAIGDDGAWWLFKLHLIHSKDGWRIDELDSLPEGGSSP